ncbi:DUF2490 domain-containing protein [Aquimarina sp. 2201CG5-10]|uniref:DUF2490 domain-containing protein n=1 Tax=Aquimarina callyspongiae TaxID=3098150 RepID=UPI002AB56651|nr:DUF2490 domain-containing protein [Aquimarina sp. 2201CG5-10]MDY8137327.1 DUF2490 domain-containing protein [Aquimarina sp. 2201CG5-10]
MKKILFIFFTILSCCKIQAQSEFSTGLLPGVRISTKISDQIKWINGLQSRHILTDNTKVKSFDYEYILTDISSLISIKIGAHGVFNTGYLIRFQDDEVIHRSIQQYNLVQNLERLRIGHRFATDQTFNTNKSPQFRLRYKISLEKPLAGDKIDPKEFYLKLGNEYLGIYQSNDTELEIRVLPFIGYEINHKNKVELGIDYRLSDFFNSGSENDLWLSMNWFYTIDAKNKSSK